MDRISEYRRYVIDVTVLNSFSFWGVGGRGFCASGRARTMKIGRRARELHKLT